MKKDSSEEMKKDSSAAEGIRLLIKLLAVALAMVILLQFVLGVFIAHTNDMFPSVRDGDLLITCRVKPIAYGDIIAYKAGGQRRFGRVVGMPGDVVDIDAGGILRINGQIPYETASGETYPVAAAEISYPFTVEDGNYFVLNDRRDSTGDSRIFGSVPREASAGSLVLLLRRRSW